MYGFWGSNIVISLAIKFFSFVLNYAQYLINFLVQEVLRIGGLNNLIVRKAPITL